MSKICTNLSGDESKRYAKNLHKALKDMGLEASLSDARHLFARSLGAKNWETLSGLAPNAVLPVVEPVPDINFMYEYTSIRLSSIFYKGEVASIELPNKDMLVLIGEGECCFEIEKNGQRDLLTSLGMSGQGWYANLTEMGLCDWDLADIQIEDSNWLNAYHYIHETGQMKSLAERLNNVEEGIEILLREYYKLEGKLFQFDPDFPYASVDWRNYPGKWDFDSSKEEYDEYSARVDKAIDDLKAQSKEIARKALWDDTDEVTGCMLAFGIGDGEAYYVIKRVGPIILQHIPYSDGYAINQDMLSGLTVEDLKIRLAAYYSLPRKR